MAFTSQQLAFYYLKCTGFDNTSIVQLINQYGIGFTNVDPTKVSSCKVAASKYDKDSIKPHAQDLAAEFGFADPDAAITWRKAQLAEYKKAGWPKDLYGRGSIKTGAAGNIANLNTQLGAYQGGSIAGIPLGTGAAPVPLAAAPSTTPEPEESTEDLAVIVEDVPSPAPPPLEVARDLVRGSYPTEAIAAGAPHLEHETLGMDILTMGEEGNMSSASDRGLNEAFWKTKSEQPERAAKYYSSEGPVYIVLNPFPNKSNYSNAGVQGATRMIVKIVRGEPLMFAFSDAPDAEVYNFASPAGPVTGLGIIWSDPAEGFSTPTSIVFSFDNISYRMDLFDPAVMSTDELGDQFPYSAHITSPQWAFSLPNDVYREIQAAEFGGGEGEEGDEAEEDPFGGLGDLFGGASPLPSGTIYLPVGMGTTTEPPEAEVPQFPPTDAEIAYYYDPNNMQVIASPIMYEGTTNEGRVLAQRPFSEEEAENLSIGPEGGDYLKVIVDMTDMGATPTDDYSGIDNLEEDTEKRVVLLTFPGDEFKLHPQNDAGDGFCLEDAVAVDPGTDIESISINREGATAFDTRVTAAVIKFSDGTTAMIPDTGTGFLTAKHVDNDLIFRGRVTSMEVGQTPSYAQLYEDNARVRKEGRIDVNTNPVQPTGERGANSGAWIDKTNFNIVVPKVVRGEDGIERPVLVRLTLIQG